MPEDLSNIPLDVLVMEISKRKAKRIPKVIEEINSLLLELNELGGVVLEEQFGELSIEKIESTKDKNYIKWREING